MPAERQLRYSQASRLRRVPAEEEGGYENISNHNNGSSEEEHHVEPAVLYQPLVSELPPDEATTGTVPLCERNTITSAGNDCSRDRRRARGSTGRTAALESSHKRRTRNESRRVL
jgi:hypothetical protein